MSPSHHFRFCPACARARKDAPGSSPFRCEGCGFTYYFNAAISAAVFLRRDDGRVLFIRRARDPGKGLLAPPGGFVDVGERVEDALKREVREEVGLELESETFLCSFPNHYPYRDVTYPVLDLFFTATAIRPETATALEDVDGVLWLDPIRDVAPEAMAFPSMQAAMRVLREQWV